MTDRTQENRKERASAMLCLGLSALFIVLFVIGMIMAWSTNIPAVPSLPEPYGMVWDLIGLVSFLLLISTIALSLIVLGKPTKQK